MEAEMILNEILIAIGQMANKNGGSLFLPINYDEMRYTIKIEIADNGIMFTVESTTPLEVDSDT